MNNFAHGNAKAARAPKWIGGIALLIAGVLTAGDPAMAGCNLTTQPIAPITIGFGMVNVRPDVPVNTVVAQQVVKLTPGTQPTWSCNPSGTVFATMEKGSPLSTDFYYSTNIQGIGIRIEQYPVFNYPYTFTFSSATFSNSDAVRVSLLKTDAITGNGPLTSGTYARMYGDGDMKTAITIGIDSNSIISSPICTVDSGSRSIQVPLGSVPLKRFTGVGATAGDREFGIQLNCAPGPGAQFTAQVRLDATPDPSGAQGVVKIAQGPSSANGVGIQLLDKNKQAVRLGESQDVGPTYDGSYQVALTARYYQTAAKVTPGAADGAATFTLTYK